MSRVVYTNIQTTPEQEALRAAHGVRLVSGGEEGTGLNALPGGLYGFTYSPGLASAPLFAPGGQSTQMIVGADATDDRTILATSARLYGTHRLRRVYYSAFSPIPDAARALPLAAPPTVLAVLPPMALPTSAPPTAPTPVPRF